MEGTRKGAWSIPGATGLECAGRECWGEGTALAGWPVSAGEVWKGSPKCSIFRPPTTTSLGLSLLS